MSPVPSYKSTRVMVATLSLAALAMLGASFAAVPIYKLICEATGLGGTTQRVTEASKTVTDKPIEIRLDANIQQGLAWDFRPEKTIVKTKLGETTLAFFKARNTSDHAITGQATFNVTPEIAGRYFNKIACFCFTEQTLQAGEAVDMPVTFYVDPAILSEPGAESIQSITLSYTFFEVPGPSRAKAAAVVPASPAKKSGS